MLTIVLMILSAMAGGTAGVFMICAIQVAAKADRDEEQFRRHLN